MTAKKKSDRLPGLVGPPEYEDWVKWRADLEKERSEVPVKGHPKTQKIINKGTEKLKKMNHRPTKRIA